MLSSSSFSFVQPCCLGACCVGMATDNMYLQLHVYVHVRACMCVCGWAYVCVCVFVFDPILVFDPIRIQKHSSSSPSAHRGGQPSHAPHTPAPAAVRWQFPARTSLACFRTPAASLSSSSDLPACLPQRGGTRACTECRPRTRQCRSLRGRRVDWAQDNTRSGGGSSSSFHIGSGLTEFLPVSSHGMHKTWEPAGASAASGRPSF